jgi:propanediol utilization protein
MNIDEILDRVEERVRRLLDCPIIPIEASGRHVHLSREAVRTLFGKDAQLTRLAELSQPGQYVCQERVRAVGPKGEFPSVVVLGPERSETQLEISRTDSLTLGLNAPVRLSGSIEGTPGIKLIGSEGEVELSCGIIIAERHIHITSDDASRWNFSDGQTVSVRVYGERPVTFNSVVLRVSDKFATYMHIDYDEANACGFYKGMAGVIIADKE